MIDLRTAVVQALQEDYGLSPEDAEQLVGSVKTEFDGLPWENVPTAFAAVLVDRLEAMPRAKE